MPKMSVKEIKDRHASWRPFHCTPENAEVFERQSEEMHRDIGALLRFLETPHALTLTELGHLSSLLVADRESGCYYGPREQYYARTERLIKWVSRQITSIAKAKGEETSA